MCQVPDTSTQRPALRPNSTHHMEHYIVHAPRLSRNWGHRRRSLARDSLGARTRPRGRSLASPRPSSNGVPLMPLCGRTPPSYAAPRVSYVMPSYSPTVSRSAWERMCEFPGGPAGVPRCSGSAGAPGKWAAGRQAPSGSRAPPSSPSGARSCVRCGAPGASRGGRLSAGVRAGVGARWRHRDRSGPARVRT